MNTEVWLIRYTDRYGRPQAVVQLHNCVADYRAAVDPRATVQRIDVAALAQAAQAAADFSFEAAMQAGNYGTAIQQHCHHRQALREAMGLAPAAATPPADDGILRGNADLVPAAHATFTHAPEPHACSDIP